MQRENARRARDQFHSSLAETVKDGLRRDTFVEQLNGLFGGIDRRTSPHGFEHLLRGIGAPLSIQPAARDQFDGFNISAEGTIGGKSALAGFCLSPARSRRARASERKTGSHDASRWLQACGSCSPHKSPYDRSREVACPVPAENFKNFMGARGAGQADDGHVRAASSQLSMASMNACFALWPGGMAASSTGPNCQSPSRSSAAWTP